MEQILRDVLDTADRLGLSAWEHVAVVLVVAVMLVFGRAVLPAAWSSVKTAIKNIKVEKAPEPISDGETAEDRALRNSYGYEVTDPLREIPSDPKDSPGNTGGAG